MEARADHGARRPQPPPSERADRGAFERAPARRGNRGIGRRQRDGAKQRSQGRHRRPAETRSDEDRRGAERAQDQGEPGTPGDRGDQRDREAPRAKSGELGHAQADERLGVRLDGAGRRGHRASGVERRRRSLQVAAKPLGTGARGGTRIQTGIDAADEPGREVGTVRRERRHRPTDLQGGLGRVRSRHRVRPRPAFVQRQGQGIDVSGPVHGLPRRLLRGHVGERPHDLPGGGQRWGAGQRRDSEVHQLRAPSGPRIGPHDHVVRLQVSVDHAAPMGMSEGGADVGPELGDLAVRQLARARELRQRRALDQLRDQDRPAVLRAQLVQRDDARVVQARRRLGLAQHALGVGAHDLLDGDLALEALVEGAVDGAHASRSHPLEDPEAPHRQLAHHFSFSFAALRRAPAPRRNPPCGG